MSTSDQLQGESDSSVGSPQPAARHVPSACAPSADPPLTATPVDSDQDRTEPRAGIHVSREVSSDLDCADANNTVSSTAGHTDDPRSDTVHVKATTPSDPSGAVLSVAIAPDNDVGTAANSSEVDRNMILVYALSMLCGVGDGVVGPYLPLFCRVDLKSSDTLVGMAAGAPGMGQACSGLLAGKLVDKYGTTNAFLTSSGLMCFAAFCSFLSTSIFFLMAVRTIGGIGLSILQTTRQTYVGQLIPSERRGSVFSSIGGLMRMCRVLGPLLGSLVAQSLSTRSTFLVEGAFYMSSGALMYCTLAPATLPADRTADRQTQPSKQHEPKPGMLAFIRQHTYALKTVGIFSFSLTIVRSSRVILLPLASHSLGMSKSGIGFVFAVSYALDTLMFPGAGHVMDTYGRKPCGVISCSLMSAGVGLLALSSSPAVLTCIGALIGVGNGLSSGLCMTLFSDLAPDKGRGLFVGMMKQTTDVGMLLGPLLVGALSDAFSLGIAEMTAGSLGLCGALWFLFMAEETMNYRATTQTDQVEQKSLLRAAAEEENGDADSNGQEMALPTHPASWELKGKP